MLPILLSILVLVGTCAYLYDYWQNRKFLKIYKEYPTTLRSVPLLGHAVNFIGNSEDRIKTFNILGQEANNKGMTSFWLGQKLIVMVGDALDVEYIMKTCLEKDDVVNVAKKLIGNASVFAPVSIWRPRRKIVAPTFGQKKLQYFVKVFNKQANNFEKQLETVVGSTIPMYDEVTKYSMDSLCETMLGIEIKSLTISKHPFVIAFHELCELTAQRMLKPWLCWDLLYRCYKESKLFDTHVSVMQKYVEGIIKTKRQSCEQQQNNKISDQEDGQPKSLLQTLIEMGNEGFTDLELREEGILMLLAGSDTTAITISFALLLLAKHPDVQEKVYQEIKNEIGLTNKSIEPNDLLKLQYLEAVLKETLRLFPPVPVITRKVDKDITLPSGRKLVAGVGIMINLRAIQKNPEHWGPDATQFKPERFLKPLKCPSAYLPFSSGPRNCVGFQFGMMSMKVVTSTLLRRFKLLPGAGSTITSVADEDIPLIYEFMLRHKDNFELKLELRN